MADFTKGIVLNPNFADAYRHRGNLKRMKGDVDGANADFDRALKLDSNPANADIISN
jgi:lipoprotein NlpI